jgi:hypothetical protein
MKRTLFLFSLATIAVALAPRVVAQTPQDALHAPDGNSFTRIVSIFIPSIPNAPFSATVSTEWTRQTSDGATIVVKNRRLVARDSQGRVFQERRRFVPADSNAPSTLFQMDYYDPIRHARFACFPGSNVCDMYAYSASVSEATVPVGPLPGGKSYLSREDLGKGEIEGLETIGTRETISANPGTIGNDREVARTKEFWYSPKLGVNLVVKRYDPLQGTQVFSVSNVSLAEPDARLFVVPAKFRVVDEREPVPPAK